MISANIIFKYYSSDFDRNILKSYNKNQSKQNNSIKNYPFINFFYSNIYDKEIIKDNKIKFPNLLYGYENVFLLEYLSCINTYNHINIDFYQRNLFDNEGIIFADEFNDWIKSFVMILQLIDLKNLDSYKKYLPYYQELILYSNKPFYNKEDYETLEEICNFIKNNFEDFYETLSETTLEIKKDMENYSPILSVIVPIYNVENYLKKSLNSIIKQFYKNIEIICVEDCSTDLTKKILKEYLKDPRIKIIYNNTNGGLGFSRNVGLKHSKGRYIQFVDSDDWLELNTFQDVLPYIESNDLDLIIYNSKKYYQEKDVWVKSELEKETDKNYPIRNAIHGLCGKILIINDIHKYLFKLFVTAWNKIYKKDFLIKNKIVFPEGLIFEDNPFFYECMVKSNKFMLLKEYYNNYRIRSDSLNRKPGIEFLDQITIVKMVFDIIYQSEIYGLVKKDLFNYMFFQIQGRFNTIDEIYKNDYYYCTKKLLKNLEDNYKILDEIILNVVEYNKDFIIKLLISDSYKEYLNIDYNTIRLDLKICGKKLLI